jgi:hypothetical protein
MQAAQDHVANTGRNDGGKRARLRLVIELALAAQQVHDLLDEEGVPLASLGDAAQQRLARLGAAQRQDQLSRLCVVEALQVDPRARGVTRQLCERVLGRRIEFNLSIVYVSLEQMDVVNFTRREGSEATIVF